MDPSATRTLGRTGVRLTPLGLGGAPLGDLFTVVSDADATATLDTAWNAGVRMFDTAPWYGRGQSELRFGRGLYRRTREDFVISTKVGRVLKPGPDRSDRAAMWAGGLPFHQTFDYSYDGVMRSFEDSLTRLGLPRIDLLVIHDLDIGYHRTQAAVRAHMSTLMTGGLRALHELKYAGLIGGFGAGVNELGTIPRYLDAMDLDFFLVAMRYTLLDQRVLDAEFPAAVARGCGFIIGSVFQSGILATGAVPGAKYDYEEPTPEQAAHVNAIEAACKRHGVSLAAAALQFPLGHPAVASVIPGAITAAQVARNVTTFAEHIPAALWAELKAEKLIRADAPTP